jgi:hypothetical protein
VTLSPLDDYPVHQIPEVMRHVGTSDRNFYDRYYFNAFPLTGDTMLIVGLGQYPNLGVTDAFALLRHGSAHRVVRASRELGADRMNTRVGPFGVEVLEALKRLRVVLDPNEHGLSFDLSWDGTIPPQVEPQHFIRSQERVVFDSKRMAQTGRWTGSITVDGETLEVTPDRWWGIRDRSWGIRPVGEPEPPGIQSRNAGTFYWLYAPVQFADHAILCIVQEDAAGRRLLGGSGAGLARRDQRGPGPPVVRAGVRRGHQGRGQRADRLLTAGRQAVRHGGDAAASTCPGPGTRPACGAWSTRWAGSTTTGRRATACTSTGRSATTRRSVSSQAAGGSFPAAPSVHPAFNIRQLTDVLRCKLQQHFRRKRHRAGR